MSKFDIEEIKEFIRKQSPSTKIYIGCDSESFRKNAEWHANYFLVVVVHYDGNKGCKVFGNRITERDYTQDKKKPRFRLMNECYKVSELFMELHEAFGDKEVEVHLDLNPDKKYASSVVVTEAIGYIRATCNVVPMVKPDAFAASYCADRLGRGGLYKTG